MRLLDLGRLSAGLDLAIRVAVRAVVVSSIDIDVEQIGKSLVYDSVSFQFLLLQDGCDASNYIFCIDDLHERVLVEVLRVDVVDVALALLFGHQAEVGIPMNQALRLAHRVD